MRNNRSVPGLDEEDDDSFKIHLEIVKKRPGCTMLRLEGVFGIQSADPLQRRLAKAIKWGNVRLIFSLRDMQFPESGEDEFREAVTDLIGSLAAFIKAVKPRGGDVVLTMVQPFFHECLRQTGFGELVNVRPDLREAVAYFAQEKTERTTEVGQRMV